MPGDFSRSSFNWPQRYSGVLMQQGRVQLDADWNEQVALAQHRTDAEAYDTIGVCGTPKTGSGFKLQLTPDGQDLLIAPGRYYAGGLLCELDPEWLPLAVDGTSFKLVSAFTDGRRWRSGDWAEVRRGTDASQFLKIGEIDEVTLDVNFTTSLNAGDSGSIAIRRAYTYLTQPFFPQPEFPTAAPTSPPNSPPNSPPSSPPFSPPFSPPSSPPQTVLPEGEYLAYLDAWQREVNWMEDGHIREVALGKPDTAVRIQTVWQLKLLNITDDVSTYLQTGKKPACNVFLPSWGTLLAGARTTGLLNARAVPLPPEANPCSLPPDAGYLGMENQLYRVEVVQGGPTLAGCTFVWSRDNGSVETSVVSVSPSSPNQVTVTDLGDDDLHALEVGDWVELVSRDDELQNTPRFFAQIVAPAPDPSLNVITLSLPVPDPSRIGADESNDFRLRRWDMLGASVTPNGIAVVDGWLDLESGVQVQFMEGSFASRDYWLIPARTITADVEWPPFEQPNTSPVPQPPIGPHHYLCRLALLASTNGDVSVQDCRTLFPALTAICADDVCYHSSCDALKEANTVQKALDALCNGLQLNFHKKYLHGWGVVCGLEVACAGDGASVTVDSGYAIDCQGNDILLRTVASFNVLEHISTPSGSPDADYSLYFDTTASNALALEPYTAPKNPLQAALEGTFWSDYFTSYLQPFVDIFKDLGTQPSNALVRNDERSLSSLIDLLFQQIDPSFGSNVYISLDEHNLLTSLYDTVRKRIRDRTLCSLFADVPASLPAYPDLIGGIQTGFGEKAKTRLRVNVAGTFAVASGGDTTIHLYDLRGTAPLLVQRFTFPASGTQAVNDCVFLSGDTQLFAIASDGTNTTLGSIPFQTAGATWVTQALAGVSLDSLAVMNALLVASCPNKGLYTAQISTQPVQLAGPAISCSCLGPMTTNGNQLFVPCTDPATGVGTIINEYAVDGNLVHVDSITLPTGLSMTHQDDLVVGPGNFAVYLYYSADGPNAQRVISAVR
ncbi:DUF6519 domain-containing protein [Granulicella tundricola]|uniref:Uncharacterized protein n=1 Tax=Granulicella tundricola (strain ATCC BAA-1859 / DSM 23138 / MP5ACTX9) TaxID=1198114 RepID=E8X5D4_GRATM|nr:DUF6519 domain-containing protein [Granulicella tundricola]ADW69481.1 hypothetical protein AciX9_2446 [Granulicella tundricola MP5ACTX9]